MCATRHLPHVVVAFSLNTQNGKCKMSFVFFLLSFFLFLSILSGYRLIDAALQIDKKKNNKKKHDVYKFCFVSVLVVVVFICFCFVFFSFFANFCFAFHLSLFLLRIGGGGGYLCVCVCVCNGGSMIYGYYDTIAGGWG